MRRFCPSEEMLGEFVSGCTPSDEIAGVEKHLAECEKCRNLVAEAHQAMKCMDMFEARTKVTGFVVRNLWLITGILSFIMSFIFSGYFFQFLLISLVSSIKWIADSRNSKTLIMIHEDRKDPRKIASLGPSHNEK
jgi:hypothetical protein